MPDNKEMAAALLNYPTNEDAKFAKEQDLFYGQPYQDYTSGQRFTHLTESPQSAYYRAAQKSTADIPISMQSMRIPHNMRGISEDFDNYYAKAGIASNRSALAALGFDPTKTAVDMGTPIKTANIAGFYSPQSDTMYSNYQKPSNIVHESMHRGIEKLSQSPLWKRGWPGSSSDELNEMVVRKLMADKADIGDNNNLKRGALGFFNNKDHPYRQKIIDDMEAAAALLIAKRKPGGPR